MNYKISNVGDDTDGIKIGYDAVMEGNILVVESQTKILANIKKVYGSERRFDKNVNFKKMGENVLITIESPQDHKIHEMQFLVTKKSHINKKVEAEAGQLLEVLQMAIEMANPMTLEDVIKLDNKLKTNT